MASKFDVVFFDLGGVLVDVNIDKLKKEFAEAAGLAVPDIELIISRHKSLFESFDKGEMRREVFVQTLLNGSRRISPGKFIEIYTSIFSLKAAVADIAENLASRYRLSIISNTDELHYGRICDDYKILELFEKPITSFDAHALKPDRRIYEYALAQLNCQPEQAVFIDDKPANVRAANEVGIKGIHFENALQLIHDLQQLGIVIQDF